MSSRACQLRQLICHRSVFSRDVNLLKITSYLKPTKVPNVKFSSAVPNTEYEGRYTNSLFGDFYTVAHILPRINRCYVTNRDTQKCWNCDKDIDSIKEQFFCNCGMIQPPQEKNYFKVFGLEESFDIDVKHLQQLFRGLQWSLHPDKFSSKSEPEQQHAQEQSSLVNQAYRVLQKPLSRGLYILQLNGHTLGEGDMQGESTFLMEIMELNEQVEEATSKSALLKIKQNMTAIIEDLNIDISKAFKKKNYVLAKEILTTLRYYANIEEKADEALNL